MCLRTACAHQISFERNIQPILADRCQPCHNEKTAAAKLSVANAPALLKGGQSGPAVKPGIPDQSLLLQTISGDKPRMPKVGPALKPEQIAAIWTWISEGAKYDAATVTKSEPWWSLKPL